MRRMGLLEKESQPDQVLTDVPSNMLITPSSCQNRHGASTDKLHARAAACPALQWTRQIQKSPINLGPSAQYLYHSMQQGVGHVPSNCDE